MTRSESLYIAISIVSTSKHPEKQQIIEGLQKCVHTVSNRKWNEENIFAACDKVLTRKGSLSASDFKCKDMPSHTDIAQVFHMSAKQFRDTYYPLKTDIPSTSPYCKHTVKEWTDSFISDYKRVMPKTQDEYNRLRAPSLPTWNTIAKMNGLTSWNNLLISLELKPDPHVQPEFLITCNLTKK